MCGYIRAKFSYISKVAYSLFEEQSESTFILENMPAVPPAPPERETESAEIKPYCTMVESQYSESLKNKQLNIVDYTLCPCEEYWITPKYNDSCHEGTHLPSSMLLCCCGYKILIFKLVVGGVPFQTLG